MSATQTLADRLSVKTSRPSCNQDDATAEAQKAQNQVIFLENLADELPRKVPFGK